MKIYVKYMQLYVLYDDICNPNYMPKYPIKNMQKYAEICRRNMQKYILTPRLSKRKNMQKYAKICKNMKFICKMCRNLHSSL